MTVSIGVDVGSGVIKTALFRVEGEKSAWLSRWDARIRQRNTFALVEESMRSVLDSAGLARGDVDYVATTGEGESLPGATGHFYSMTTHARGPCTSIPRRARCSTSGRCTAGRSPSTEGEGPDLPDDQPVRFRFRPVPREHLRYLGIAQDEIGALSQQATKPEKVSSICAVLAETDVINMVSRAIKPGDILRGIHESMAERLIKLLKSIDVKRGS